MSEPFIINPSPNPKAANVKHKIFTSALVIFFAVIMIPATGISQGKYYNNGCEKLLYPTIELSVETGALTGFNFSFGLTAHEFPVSAHVLLNCIPSEAGKTKTGAPDIQVNPMLMLKFALFNSENYR